MSDEIVKVYCPECNKSYKVKKAILGKKTTCRQCSVRFELKLRKKAKPKSEKIEEPPPPVPESPPEAEGDPNGLKHCPTCELQTEHENNVCTVCNHKNTGEKPLVEKIKSHPLLSKEIKTPVGTFTMIPLLSGGVVLLLAGLSYFLFMGEEEKPKRKPRPKKPVAAKAAPAKPKVQTQKPVEKEPEEQEPQELLPEVSVYMKQGANIRPVPVKQVGELIFAISTSKELISIDNKNEEMQYQFLHQLGSFRKFRYALYFSAKDADKAITLKATSFDETKEQNVIFHDFEKETKGFLKKEGDDWLFTAEDETRPRKIAGILLGEDQSLIGLVSGIKGTSLICYPINSTLLDTTGQWIGEKPLQELIQ